ncbi:NCS1 nucleoside transporter [Fusarium tjaetaba]|uniref:NCS1 nucleoside transporter n=1 Tax=Fusarium tjaetaba TaxID=1567544 RepID=A0A8H5QF63_9HYPO|nr:NCS1 nucleoside transporter [Fusarium tjaetaba]KAF5612741.1 NCS1 nucleoside transporter [Fusarium tjaetaba]
MALRTLFKRLEIPRETDEFVGLWVVTGAFNVGGWMTGSSVIALGLNVWQAMLTVIIGNILVGIICVLTGAPGAKWHVGFSILQNASWGMYGALFPLVQRIMLSFIWYSTQVWWGGQCTKTFLTALWPSFRNLNTPLAHGTMDTGDLTAFIVFWSLCLPLIWVPPEKYKIPFAIAACSVAPTVLALMICQSDFTRFSRRPGDQLLSQLLFVPLSTVSVALIGILCTSCASQLFPETNGTLLWEPYRMLATVQTHFDDSPRARVAVAFASLAFAVAQFGIAVAENALSNGIDLSALVPRYFNLRRGGYLTAVFAFVMQPWELMNGASNFLTVMGGYGVFLGSMTGVMFSDYYLVRQRRLMLTGLYDASSTSIYWYWLGVNWRAPVAWLAATWLLLPGFVRRVQDPTAEWNGWSHLYYMSWPLGCFLAMLFYYLLARAFPVPQPQAVDDADYFGTFGLANDFGSVLEGEAVSGNGSLAKKDQAVLSSEEMNQAV